MLQFFLIVLIMGLAVITASHRVTWEDKGPWTPIVVGLLLSVAVVVLL